MTTKVDVLIIGGGVIGVSSAYYLAQEGLSVALVEKEEICAGSSYGNAGLISPTLATPIPAPGVIWQGLKWMTNPESPFYIKPRLDPALLKWLWQFRSFCNEEAVHRAVPFMRDISRASLQLYHTLIEQEGVDCSFDPSGGLSLYLTEEKFADGRHEAETVQKYGIKTYVLSGDEARELDPGVGKDVIGALHHAEDAHFNPADFVNGLAERLPALGVAVHTNCAVTRFEMGNGRIETVQTTAGIFHAEQVVLSAGIWSTQLARQVGVDIPMQAAKGYSITMNRPPNTPRMHWHLGEARCAVTPIGDYLRFAGTLELAGINQSYNERRIKAIWNGARQYMADQTVPEIVEKWNGMRPTSPDGLPYIGRTSQVDNLLVATGHAMLGISMGPATGKLMAQLICRQSPMLDISAFTVDRFA